MKEPTFFIVNQQDGWAKFWEALPFWVILLLLAVMGIWYFEKCWKWMNGAMDHLDKRMKETERRLEGIDKALSDHREYWRQVDALTRELERMEEAITSRNPIDAIAEEEEEDLDR